MPVLVVVLAVVAIASTVVAVRARRRPPLPVEPPAPVVVVVPGGPDADLLWALEQLRSERTWRHSVAIGPDSTSVFAGADDALHVALQVEIDAARDDIGAVVDLDAELPRPVTASGRLLTLRTAQELLARAVKLAEEATLRVRADGDDLVVTVDAIDEDGAPVVLTPLAIPPSVDVEPVEGGARIKRAMLFP